MIPVGTDEDWERFDALIEEAGIKFIDRHLESGEFITSGDMWIEKWVLDDGFVVTEFFEWVE